MKRSFLLLAFWGLLAMGCSAIPTDIQKNALPAMPFSTLIKQAGQYIGETVILGGYVLEVRNLKTETRITAIQVPLDEEWKPTSRDLSQGIIIVKYKGLLDPKVYAKDSKITVAGDLLSSSATKNYPLQYPTVELRLIHIHLWSD